MAIIKMNFIAVFGKIKFLKVNKLYTEKHIINTVQTLLKIIVLAIKNKNKFIIVLCFSFKMFIINCKVNNW